MAMTKNPHTNTCEDRFFLFPLFFSFLPSLPPSQTLYIPPATMPSVSHLMALPVLTLGGLVCARAVIFCEFQVKPMLQLTCGQFCSMSTLRPQLGMGPRCFPVAVSTWLVATCLSHKVQARFKHVLWCVYLQFGGRRVFGMNCCTYRI